MGSNEQLGNVRVLSSKRNSNKHALRHRVNTSCSFTDVNVLMCDLLAAGDKPNLRIENAVWLAPVLRPVFGTLNYHQWAYFVKMSDLTRNWPYLLSQTPVSRNGNLVKPKMLPTITRGLLSSLCLFGSHCTLWLGTNTDFVGNESGTYKLLGSVDTDQDADVVSVKLLSEKGIIRYVPYRTFDGFNGYVLNLQKVMSDGIFVVYDTSDPEEPGTLGPDFPCDIPLNNHNTCHFVDARTATNSENYSYGGLDESPVYLESADYVIEVSVNSTYRVAIAFRFSDFGRRLKKDLEGIGNRINLASKEPISIMSLFAIYKAYYEIFGIQRYTNWENTACAKLLSMYDTKNFVSATFGFCLNEADDDAVLWYNLFQEFIKDLAFMYTTDSVNYISAHQLTAAIGQMVNNSLLSGIDVNRTSSHNSNPKVSDRVNPGLSSDQSGTSVDYNPDNRPFIMTPSHGQLDAEFLKKLYLWVNRDTIAGQRVEELLRVQGYGEWVDDQKVHFVGHNVTPIEFGSVIATSDTYQKATEEGAPLGDRGGKGSGYGKGKTFTFTANEEGFFVILSAIVPESDFCQQNDAKLACNEKFKFYNREFDGLGYEASRKDQICGDLFWLHPQESGDWNESGYVTNGQDRLGETLGYLPRHSKLKFVHSKAMGDFSLPSRREFCLPMMLDKFINLNSHSFSTSIANSGGSGSSATPTTRRTYTKINLTFSSTELPVIGDWSRYTARYQWLGHLYRIFSAIGQTYASYGQVAMIYRKWFEFFGRTYDNFIIQHDFDYTEYSQKLQLGDSFETSLEGNEGETNMNLSKA